MRSARGLYWLLPVLLFLLSSEAVEDDNYFEAGEIQREIDNEIAKYLEDVKKVLHKDEKRKLMKRSTSASEINLSRLEEAPRFSSIERLYELPDPFAVDVVLFCLPAEKDGDEKCFAASLLTSDTENVDQLVLYTLNGDKFAISDRTEVKNGRSLATHNIGGVQYIVVAENRLVDSNETVSDLFVSPVYAVNSQTGRLRRLHYLGDGHLNDAIIWEQKGTDHVFLATASAAIEGSQPGDVSHVYRWMGNHFDTTHTVATSNASRITHFTIGGNMFLAVANAGTDAANMFSAVYMYNLHEERFVLHQKLPTHSATDIKSFTLHLAEGSETFLAVTSSGHNNHPSVIIYKLLPDSYHFVPMQLLPLEGVEDSKGTEGKDDTESDAEGTGGRKGTEGGTKGTEGTKVTEGSAELLLPVVHEDASGVLASVLLVASRKWGVKVYQYDGWRFVLSETQLNQQEFGPGVSSMRLFRFKGRNVVTLVNKRSVSLVFSVKWKVNDVMKALQSHLESWCDQVLKEEEDLETASNNLLREAQWAPKLNESFETGGCLIFENTNTLIRTVEVTNDVMKPDNEAVRKKFEEVREEVKKTEETLKQITQKELVFEEPVVLESADFKCLHGCVFLNLDIETLNGENFSSFLDNSHGLTGKHIDKIEFESLKVTSRTAVDKINGRPIKHLITSDGDEDLRFDINVNGRVTFNGKLTVNGEIDGVKFDNNTMLLDSGVQFFNNSELKVESLIVDKLTVKNQQPQFKSTEINNVEVESPGNNFIPVLDVEELILDDNKISGVDFGDFVEKTLKKTGGKEQVVEGFHHYKVLIADEIEAPNYKPVYESGVELEDNKVGDEIVDNGKPRGNKAEDVIKDKVGDDKAEDVIIDHTKRGNDDVDKNSDPTLPKKCSGAQCVEEQFRIDGDFEIDGSLVIENATLFVEDVYLGHENISLSDLLKNGLKLDGGMISDVVFQAPIFVRHLDVDSVNNIDPNSWIDGCDPGSEPIVVTGHKVFTDSLNLEKGGSVTGKINEIPVDSLMFDTLRKDGDQDVGGFKHIGKITAKVIESDSLALKNDDVTGKTKTHSGGDLVVNHMKGRMLRAKTINGVVLEDVINDTLFKDNETYIVESKTTFTNDLKTDELFCDDVYELSNHTNERRMAGDSTPVRNTTGSENLNLTSADVEGKQLKVDRLFFTGSLDGVTAGDFGNWLMMEGDQTIESFCEIKNIEAKNGVKLATGLLNGVDLDQFVKDMINISEPVVLTSDFVFEGEVVVENGVKIGGLVNGVEFSEEELVLKGVDPVVFGGEKVLEGGLQAKSIDVDALKTFCQVVVEPQGDGSPSQPLKVVGNVEFSKEPTITFLNNHSVSELLDSLWFVDEDITIDHDIVLGDVELKGNLNMSAESEVNGKNLTRLREEYFSLSADQKITNDLIFDKISADGMRVVERVQAYKLVAGMNFDEFVGSVMRQKRRQRVTAILDFEDVVVDGVLNANASWTVNGLDFKKDLMRWNNSVNIVRGKTRLTSLKTQSLEAKPGVLIQGIDISRWKQLAVTGSGRFNVSGHKTFDSNVYVDEDLRVHGLVNGIRFDPDSVLLSERYQTVNGHYLFGPETVLDVEDILSNSLVDGVNITYLLDQQVCKDDTNHLITGNKTFRSRFSVANQVEMRRHFADIDLVQLHNQLMSPYEGLARDNRLTALASIRKDVELSLATRAHLFTGWEKLTQVAGRVRLALPLDGKMERVVFVGRFSAEEVRMRLSLNYWDVRGRRFVETDERRFFMKRPIDATVVETATGENRLFTLFKSSNASVRTGVIYNVSSSAEGSLSHVSVGTFDTSAANRVLYLTDNCFLLWGQQVPECYVYCSWQRVFSFQCSDVNQIIRFKNDSAVQVLMAKSTGVVEVRSFVESELQYVATLAVGKEPALRMDVISHPITHHSILVACGETAVTFVRFDLNWQKMDSASLSLQQASARLLALPTNEIVAIVMSSCSPPTTYRWAGLSQPQATNLPIGGSEVRQVYQFQDSRGANYTLVVSDRETAVLKPLYFIDDFEA